MIDSWQQELFQLLYNNRHLYWLASTIPFAGQWRTWQRLVLPKMRGKSALEIGCGLGDLLADIIGCDLDLIELGSNRKAILVELIPELIPSS